MRVTNAPASRKRRKRMVTAAKGYRMRRSKLYRYASDAVDHGRQYAYRDRRVKKRTFRYLWQIRINAAARALGMTYSRFMEGIKAANCALDRKVLADIAATDSAAFGNLVTLAQNALKTKATTPKVAPQAAAPKAAKAKVAKAGADDLEKIEGIGPKVNDLLKAASITTFAQLAATPVAKLKEILHTAGSHFAMMDPTTWPEQSALAAKGDWAALEKLEGELKGGRRV
jgi:large subunit ribosomal protein L20